MAVRLTARERLGKKRGSPGGGVPVHFGGILDLLDLRCSTV